jgi:hypothetical protein
VRTNGTGLIARLCAVLLTATAIGARVQAQTPREPVASAADVAISQGRLDDAEKLLFDASSRSTHEPSARGALGMFLASRGRFRIGAVLLEEARQFGGDAKVIDAQLARIYPWLSDWAAVAALKHYATAGPENDRARWLSGHPPAHSGPDSVNIPMEPNELFGLGRIEITVGRVKLLADIDPNIDGLMLPSNPDVTAESQQFGMRDSATVAVVREFSIGAMHFSNVPARLSPIARPTIGLDVLAALTPSFAAGSRGMTLHQHAYSPPGDALPILLSFPGLRLVYKGQAPVAMTTAAGRAALRTQDWTFDVRHGAILVTRYVVPRTPH